LPRPHLNSLDLDSHDDFATTDLTHPLRCILSRHLPFDHTHTKDIHVRSAVHDAVTVRVTSNKYQVPLLPRRLISFQLSTFFDLSSILNTVWR
jgi:hypothetical protein